MLSRYAAAVVRRVRKHPQELGCIREDELLGGELDYQDFELLPPDRGTGCSIETQFAVSRFLDVYCLIATG